MTFLAPIPALIAAAIAVPALISLYFLKLRRRSLRVSSTLFWVSSTRDLQVNVPFRWLRFSWLLLLQLAILALFLGAFARPAIVGEGGPARRIVLLIDRSASMSATDSPSDPSRLDEAKRRAAELVDRVLGGSSSAEACIVGLAGGARAVTGFTQDRSVLKAAIRELGPTDQPGDLGAGLKLAGALLAPERAGEEEGGPGRAGQVVLFSDGAFSGAGPYTLIGAGFRFERVGPSPGARDNLGIVAVAARRDHDDPGAVRVFARVQNASASAIATTLTLSLNGEPVDRRAITLPGADAAGTPGQGSAGLEARTTGGGVLTVSIGRDDVLDCDDGAALVLAPALRPRIIFVAPPTPDAGVREGPEWLLTDVLREVGASSLRVLTPAQYETLDAQEGGPGADLVIFDRVRPARTPRAASISFGAGLPVAAPRVIPSDIGRGTHVLRWERAHPILRHVSLDSVFIASPMRVDASVPDDARMELTELAHGPDGPLIVLTREGPLRRLFVAFELAQSTWPRNFGFPIFLSDAIDYLTLRDEGGVRQSYSTVEPVDVRAGAPGARIVITGPRTVTEIVPEGVVDGRIGIGVLDRCGVYRVEGGGAPESIAVNLLDETESALRTADSIAVGGEAVASGAGDSGPVEIWPWFILAALALLAVEWFANAWMMRI